MTLILFRYCYLRAATTTIPQLRSFFWGRLMRTKLLLVSSLLLSITMVAADKSKTTSVSGYVIDSSCAFTKGLEKPISRDCALKCARAGSPLVVLSDDKTVYWPISDKMPAQGQNTRLMEFAGKHVEVAGEVFDRGGSKAIVIEKISVSAAK